MSQIVSYGRGNGSCWADRDAAEEFDVRVARRRCEGSALGERIHVERQGERSKIIITVVIKRGSEMEKKVSDVAEKRCWWFRRCSWGRHAQGCWCEGREVCVCWCAVCVCDCNRRTQRSTAAENEGDRREVWEMALAGKEVPGYQRRRERYVWCWGVRGRRGACWGGAGVVPRCVLLCVCLQVAAVIVRRWRCWHAYRSEADWGGEDDPMWFTRQVR